MSLICCTAIALNQLAPKIRAAITIEQIEEYDNAPPPNPVPGAIYNTAYAPVAFDGTNVQTVGQYDEGGTFPFQTFYAIDGAQATSSFSNHAYYVGMFIYGAGSIAYPFVKNIYCQAATNFLTDVVQTQDNTGVGPAPGDFVANAKVINCSWAFDYTPGSNGYTSTADTDAINRMDYMIANDNVTFVASCLNDPFSTGADDKVPWGDFNALAVSGSQPVSPRVGVGKQHADLYLPSYASFTAAAVSGYATGLYANATAANQSDAMQNVVSRSLLMAGTDKTTYSPTTANHLDVICGAGEPDYDTSLAILEAGEQPLLNASGGTAIGSSSTQQYGWTYGSVPAGGQEVILFNSSNAITSVSASLNWNVTSPVTGGNINTSGGALQFPNLTLEVRPVTYSNGAYLLGTAQTNAMLRSAATGDNIQYIYNTSSLAAGQYAFVISGDAALPAAVGLSYALGGTFSSQWIGGANGSWGDQRNWETGITNGRGAVANFPAAAGSVGIITLDGDRTVGNLSLATSTTINAGVGGQLLVDDTGDSTGIADPQINVSAGSSTVNAPINMVYGVNITTAPGTSLSLLGGVTGNYIIIKYGTGTLKLSGSIGGQGLAPVAGTTLLLPGIALNCQAVYVNPSTTVTFAPSSTNNILVRNAPVMFYLDNGGLLTLAAASSSANRQVLDASTGIYMVGSPGHWNAKLDLSNNDMDLFYPNLSDTLSKLQQGYNNGAWNGSGGYVSSSAASDTTHLTALGAIQNNQGGQPIFTALHPFDTISPGVSDTLVKYTYYGDCNLDGKVDGSDYSLIDYAYLADQTNPGSCFGWYYGDFNYDGVINGSDYTLIDNTFNLQSAALNDSIAGIEAGITDQIAATNSATEISQPSQSVPEPSSISVLVIGVFLSRRTKCRFVL